MPVPVTYEKTASNAISTYDYTDIANGLGIAEFYLGRSSTSGVTADYILTSNGNLYSSGRGSEDIKVFSGVFAVSFNSTRTMKGTPIVNFAAINYKTPAGGTANVTAQLRKVSNGTTTNVTNAINSEPISGVATFTAAYRPFSIELPMINSEEVFRTGDQIQIFVSGVSSCTNSSIGISPVGSQDRQASADGGLFEGGSSRSTLFLPFKINI